ncbi:MAG: DNA repair protein RecO [Bacteroidetes bacterium]|nr:DNA repair protein RecO [Bacteroidota bacterium]
MVLQTRRFRESSKIVTFYTREFGKLGAVARGVLQPKNRYGSVLQPMAHLAVLIYRKEGRDLHNLSTAESIERYGVLNSSLERMSAGLSIMEIVNATMHDEDRNDELFDLIVAALRMLNDPEAGPGGVQLWFHVRLASILGYAIAAEQCGVCGEAFDVTLASLPFNLAIGAPLCSEHRESMAYRPVNNGSFAVLRRLLVVEANEAAREMVGIAETTELGDLLTSFIRYHVDGIRKLKARGVAAKVLDGGPART